MPKLPSAKFIYASPQRGVALIMAVLVAAMITATAVTMATTHRFSMQRGFNQINNSALQFGMQNLESDIDTILSNDRRLGAVDSLNEAWATEIQISNFSNIEISGVITDLQAFYNLTNLATQFGVATASNSVATSRTDSPAHNQADSQADNQGTNQENNQTGDANAQSSAAIGSGNPLVSSPFASNFSNTTADETPSVSAQRQVFDWKAHQEFVDSYVESCADENQKCAEQAIALAYQRSSSVSNSQTNDAQHDSQSGLSNLAQSGARIDSLRVPNSPIGTNVASTTGSPESNSPVDGFASGGAPGSKAPDSEAQLTALFHALDLDLEPIQAILDWVDADSETRYPNGAEDEHYTGLEKPYRTGNGPFATVRELLLVRGISLEVYEKLSPYLVALPQQTPININTASADLLMSIHPMIDRTTAELLIDARKVQAFQSVKAFAEHPALLGLSIPVGRLSVSSEYFQISATALSSDMQTHHRMVVKRTNNEIETVRRARGYFQ